MADSVHALVVEDDEMVQNLLSAYLQQCGYRVTAVGSAAAMWQIVASDKIDIVLLDLGLPDEDGIAVARMFRSKHTAPLMIITARSDRDDRLAALRLGADDYLVKPFDPQEMLIRVENLLARARGGTERPARARLKFPGFSIDLDAHAVSDSHGAAIDVTASEFSLLAAFARAPNRVLSRDQLLDALSRAGDAPGARVIDVLVGRLRKKLGDDPKNPEQLRTVVGFGYMLRTH